jgi:hypothetical protein
MLRNLTITFMLLLLFTACEQKIQEKPVRLITLDPGHFHAALVQKEMYPGVDSLVYIYAPEGQDLFLHLARIDQYNSRTENPTKWQHEIYVGPDYLEKLKKTPSGNNVVVLAGNNRIKSDYIRTALESGMNVLADKPLIIRPENFPRLEESFSIAKQKNLLLYDIMTERFEITSLLQREFSRMPEIFGEMEKGTLEEPAVIKESVHHFYKNVSGKPLVRPAWFFDVNQQGEGLVDVTTHLVDLVQWTCFPDEILNYKSDVEMLQAERTATEITRHQFQQVTGLTDFPEYLRADVSDSVLQVFQNGQMDYTLRGIHARVSVKWNFYAGEGRGDTHFSLLKGTRANLIIRQGAEQNFKPVLFIEPVSGNEEIESALSLAVKKLNEKFPGISVKPAAIGWEVVVPEKYAEGHEAHFASVTKNFLGYLKDGSMPEWEVPNMLCKYYTTMRAYEMAHEKK